VLSARLAAEHSIQQMVAQLGSLRSLQQALAGLEVATSRQKALGFPAARTALRLRAAPQADDASAAHDPLGLAVAHGHAGLVPLSARLAQLACQPQGWRESASVDEAVRAQPGTAFEHRQGLDSRRAPAELPLDPAALGRALASASVDPQTGAPLLPSVLLVFVGGVTRAEIATLRRLSAPAAAGGAGVAFTILATSLITADSLVRSIASGDFAFSPPPSSDDSELEGGGKLHSAVERGDAAALRQMLQDSHGAAQIDDTNSDGRTALHAAVLYGQPACLQLLLQRGASPTARDEGLDTPLHLAACVDETADCVRLLLDGDAHHLLSTENRRGFTPLHCACASGNTDGLSWLLSAAESLPHGGRRVLEAKDEAGRTAVAVAAAHGRCSAIAMMLDHGAAPRPHCLLLACANGHLPAVELLLSRGVSVDAASRDGVTPLLASVRGPQEKSAALIKLLLAAGARPGLRGGGVTPLQAALDCGNSAAAALLRAAKEVTPSRALQRVASVSAPANDDADGCCSCFGGGKRAPRPSPSKPAPLKPTSLHPPPQPPTHPSWWTPLQVAASRPDASSLLSLLEQEPFHEPEELDAALHVAAGEASAACVSVLLSHGASAGARTAEDNRTALHLVCASAAKSEAACAAAAALLAVSGCDVNDRDVYAITPLHLAAQRGDPALVRALLLSGADAGLHDCDGKTAEQCAKDDATRAAFGR